MCEGVCVRVVCMSAYLFECVHSIGPQDPVVSIFSHIRKPLCSCSWFTGNANVKKTSEGVHVMHNLNYYRLSLFVCTAATFVILHVLCEASQS